MYGDDMKGKIIQVEYAADKNLLFVVTSEGQLWQYDLVEKEWQQIK